MVEMFKGDGTFEKRLSFANKDVIGFSPAAPMDVNEDGIMDLVAECFVDSEYCTVFYGFPAGILYCRTFYIHTRR